MNQFIPISIKIKKVQRVKWPAWMPVWNTEKMRINQTEKGVVIEYYCILGPYGGISSIWEKG